MLPLPPVAPGYISTEMNTALIADETRARQILERIPSNRWGTPDDFTGAIVFLAGKGSDYVCGECVTVSLSRSSSQPGRPCAQTLAVGGLTRLTMPSRARRSTADGWRARWLGSAALVPVTRRGCIDTPFSRMSLCRLVVSS